MIKLLTSITLICASFSMNNSSPIEELVQINISTYQSEGKTKAMAMPALKTHHKYENYNRRLEYLLMNKSVIHNKENFKKRLEIWSVYPDTNELRKRYLDEFVKDEKLSEYFTTSVDAMETPTVNRKVEFTQTELMQVASRFFYCNKVKPDTNIEAHVCVGINGVKEAGWMRDFTLLEAFCYEAIFSDFDKEKSLIWDTFEKEKKASVEKFKSNIIILDDYLAEVKAELFSRMEKDDDLNQNLLKYYETNKLNLAFSIIP